MKMGFKVGDAMTIDPVTISAEDSIDKCAKIMKEKNVGSLLVLNENKLIGILTEFDIVRGVVALEKNPKKVKVKEIMVKRPVTISPDKDIYEALVKLRDNDIRHLPVTVGQDLKGFLTLKDIMKLQPELFELALDNLRLKELPERNKPSFESGTCDGCHNFSSSLLDEDGMMLCRACRKASR